MNGGNRLSVPQGQVLFHAGDACNGFVIVHSGTIKVSLIAENGREIILYRVRPGDICLQTFGCLVNHRPYHAEGVAESDLEIEVITPAAFAQRVSNDSDFRDRLFGAVAARFADMEQLVEDVALTGFTARLSRCLLRLADSSHVIAATHESLATEIGSGRAAVSRGLGALARKGVISIERGRIRLLDPASLITLSHEAE